jgi:hypothetical protein
MHGSRNTTVNVAVEDPRPATPQPRSVLGLVYLWSKHELHRAGEVALREPEIGSIWVYGRGTGEEDRLGRARVRRVSDSHWHTLLMQSWPAEH